MKQLLLNYNRKFLLPLVLMFGLSSISYGQNTITISTGNLTCSATNNEFQFDVLVTNNGPDPIQFNGAAIRLTHSAAILAGGTNTIVFSFVNDGLSDFPLVWPPNSAPAFTYTPATRLFGVSTSTGIYLNGAGCAAPNIANGATKKIGRFSVKNTAQNFVAGADVGLAWNTSTAVTAYVNCALGTTGFNNAGANRTLTPPCTLFIPAGCTAPTVGSSPSDQSVCTSGTATFTGSFTGGSPVPTTIWQVQTGGVGLFTDLTETTPYSGTASNTLTITAPNISLSTNRYRMITTNCTPIFTNSALLTVNPNVSAGTVSGTSPLCIGATTTYNSTGTAGGTWSSTFPLVASVNGAGLVTALSAGSTDITYTVNSGCGSPVSNFQSLTVSPNVSAGTVSGTSPLCIGATANYTSNGTAGGTWSSTFPLVASVNGAGLVTALSAGSTDITYTVNSGCGSPVSSFQSLTVNPNVSAGTVSGTSPLCIGATTTYNSTGTAGGTWSSTFPLVASVNGAGLVTALSAGSTDITYTVNSGCGSPVSSFQSLTVSPNVSAGTVSGTSPLCIGATPTYTSNGTVGGTWSSTFPLVASVNGAGLVTTLSAGSTDITYTVNSGCGSPVSSFQSLTVSPNVSAGTVSGTSPLCIGATANYTSNGTAGGTWSSTFPLVASVNGAGLVTALSAGSTDITYTVNSGCGSPVSSFQSLTVSPNVSAGTVSGTSPLCIGSTANYTSNGTAGGTWSSTFPLVASVDGAGLVTALSSGTTDITYTVNSGCGSPVSSFQSLAVSPGQNTGTVSGTSPLCISNTATYTSNGDPGGTWSSTNTAVATVDAAGVVTTLGAGSTDIRYSLTGTCTAFSFKTLTVTPFTSLAATAGGAQVCSSANVLAGGSSYSDGSCNLIAKVLPSGAIPVGGSINVCVRVEDVVHTYQSAPYVQRVYDIEPATNAAIATATITLYYTQAEFTAYNLARGAFNALPASSGDVGNIPNIRITQYHGTGTYPGNYTGPQVPTLIDPVDANVIWNPAGSGRWEITFDVTGFSGFYLSSKPIVLPVTLLNFSGRNNGNYNVLDWTTSSEQNSSYFGLERSTNGVNYVNAVVISSAGNSSLPKNYNYNDNITAVNSNIYYYRLKMVDVNGSIKYSSVVKIKLNTKGFNVEATPNPFADQLRINIETELSENAQVSLKDISGRTIQQKESQLRKGNNALQLNDLGRVPAGVYLLTITTDSQHQTVKVVKQ